MATLDKIDRAFCKSFILIKLHCAAHKVSHVNRYELIDHLGSRGINFNIISEDMRSLEKELEAVKIEQRSSLKSKFHKCG